MTDAPPLYQDTQQTTVHITLVVAASYPLVREAFRTLLEGDPQFSVLGEASDGREAITRAGELRPDVLLLDDAMPDMSAIDMLRELSKLTPAVRSLLITADDESGYALEALALGARGIILKNAPSHFLFKAIYTVVEGHYWVGRNCLDGLIDQMRDWRSRPGGPGEPTLGLSARELQVVSTIVAGYTNDEIARALRISVKTVKRHLTTIFDKVGTSNRLELASFAIRNRLASEPAALPPTHRT